MSPVPFQHTRSVFIVHEGGRPSGIAFVEFPNPQEASGAMGKNKQMMGSRYVEIFPANRCGTAAGAGSWGLLNLRAMSLHGVHCWMSTISAAIQMTGVQVTGFRVVVRARARFNWEQSH